MRRAYDYWQDQPDYYSYGILYHFQIFMCLQQHIFISFNHQIFIYYLESLIDTYFDFLKHPRRVLSSLLNCRPYNSGPKALLKASSMNYQKLDKFIKTLLNAFNWALYLDSGCILPIPVKINPLPFWHQNRTLLLI